MAQQPDARLLLSGRYFTARELFEVKEMVRMFPNLSRTELAMTICENLGWVTPVGQYKVASCQHLLEWLEGWGLVALPRKREKVYENPERIEFGPRTQAGPPVEGSIADLEPIVLEPVRGSDGIRLWNEYLHRYHALGYRRPFGAHQRYFIVSKSVRGTLGCLLFAAAAWALAPRDEWIGWSEVDRSLRLNLVVNNSRFLIFPWVRVRNLASKVLSMVAKRIGADWQERYGYRPVLLETFVDPERYRGACYRAANWVYLGRTQGRGRTGRHNERPFSRKDIYVYPLFADFRARLKGETAHE